jgi:prepilin-type N-terminal cleavage/methylation domain-containing protein
MTIFMNNIFKQKTERLPGFSFIELLVVIAIIGLLGTISTIAFSSIRSKEVDTRRITDMKKISFALERYHLVHGKYPVCSGNNNCDYVAGSGWYTCLGEYLEPFLGKIPVDPVRKDGVGYCYTVNSSSPNPQYASNQITLQYHLDSYVNPTSVGADSYSLVNGVYLYYIIIQPYVK